MKDQRDQFYENIAKVAKLGYDGTFEQIFKIIMNLEKDTTSMTEDEANRYNVQLTKF